MAAVLLLALLGAADAAMSAQQVSQGIAVTKNVKNMLASEVKELDTSNDKLFSEMGTDDMEIFDPQKNKDKRIQFNDARANYEVATGELAKYTQKVADMEKQLADLDKTINMRQIPTGVQQTPELTAVGLDWDALDTEPKAMPRRLKKKADGKDVVAKKQVPAFEAPQVPEFDASPGFEVPAMPDAFDATNPAAQAAKAAQDAQAAALEASGMAKGVQDSFDAIKHPTAAAVGQFAPSGETQLRVKGSHSAGSDEGGAPASLLKIGRKR